MNTIVLEAEALSAEIADAFDREDRAHLNGAPAAHLPVGRSASVELSAQRFRGQVRAFSRGFCRWLTPIASQAHCGRPWRFISS